MMDLSVVEIVLMGFIGVLGYVWRVQAGDIKQTSLDLNRLSIKFAESKGGAEATNRTLFSNIEEMKDAIARIESHLISSGGKKNVG